MGVRLVSFWHIIIGDLFYLNKLCAVYPHIAPEAVMLMIS